MKKMAKDKFIHSDEWEFKMEPEHHNFCKCSRIMESHGGDVNHAQRGPLLEMLVVLSLFAVYIKGENVSFLQC